MSFENKPQSLLTFKVGPVLCCAPSLPVRSIITPPKLTHPPGSDRSQPGIFKHGNHIVKVLDLRQKFGIHESEQNQPGNLIITLFEKESLAFWVDQILDVFDFPNEGWGNLPTAIPRGVFSQTLLLNNKIHLYSEFEKLAAISNLGYLKKYIQQLQIKQASTRPIQETSLPKQKPNITNPSSLTVTTTTTTKTLAFTPLKQQSENKPNANIVTVKDTTNVAKTLESKSDNRTIKNSADKINPLHINNHTKITTIKKIKSTAQRNSSATHPSIKSEKSAANFVNKNTSFSNRTSISAYKTHDDDESIIAIMAMLTILISIFAFGVYYFFTEYTVDNTHIIMAENEHALSSYNLDDKEKLKSLEADKNNYEKIDVHVKVDSNKEHTGTIHDKKTSTVVKENEHEEYRADISQIDNEITIIIHQPTIKSTVDDIERPTTILKPIVPSKNATREIIHIIVKGDTLWAIAKKYVNDPFLYPELARLSNIKNPHRIYPGNQVRIRFVQK